MFFSVLKGILIVWLILVIFPIFIALSFISLLILTPFLIVWGFGLYLLSTNPS